MFRKKEVVVASKEQIEHMMTQQAFQNFITNDKDGFTARDYLTVTTTAVYFLFIAIGCIAELCGVNVGKMYIQLLDRMELPLMTVIGTTMGTRITELIVNRNRT